ncbi:MAG: alanine--tRNA ligase [Parcubacteria group bacterium 21-54-25]|nr:MAG: alanine--tRNA ligase [Parcubacteria group bacterium 21-54-25]HQU07828.1 alanine--tRNA ligase [Candidatus Paceibacterota bacterium]
MTVAEVRDRYLAFFEKRGHVVIPSAAIVPENDPTTLFTSSGMQPLVPYLLGEPHPKGSKLVNSQMCFRAEDIEEVGDNRHTTFFEMLGNWSLGDYFKKEQLPRLFEFLTNREEGLGLDPEKLYVTVFAGDEDAGMGKDGESVMLWQGLFKEKGIDAKFVELGTEEVGSKTGMQGGRIFAYGAKKNWWSRSGVPNKMPAGEPGGPDSEVFYDFGTPHDTKFGTHCHPNCDCGRFIEIGNSVFMQYVKQEDGSFAELPKKNVDFGGGLERLAAATLHNPDVFLVDVFDEARAEIARHAYSFLESKDEKPVYKKYASSPDITKAYRVILDHIRAATFMIADGVRPSNTEQGYVLRRLIRRAVRFADFLHLGQGKETVHSPLTRIAQYFIDAYAFGKNGYSQLAKELNTVINEIGQEEKRFRNTLANGMRELEKMGDNIDAFVLFTTYGFPIELTEEIAKERGVAIDTHAVRVQMKDHQEKSRAGAAQKFKGGLADTSTETTMLHTTTHLMLAGLRKYLGDHVHQAGSNITAERTRFDFTHPEKVSREILDKVEAYVNEAIEKGAAVTIEQVPKDAARAAGVEGSFWEKYPDVVNVYTVKADDGTIYSQELCGGPHVAHTGVIRDTGKRFKIVKEEASSAGVRRIKAVLQ